MSALGVVCALDWEAACLPAALGLTVVTCGVGAGRAETAAAELARRGVCGLVSFGSAGALDPQLEAGDLVLPSRVWDEGGTAFECDRSRRFRLAEACARHGLRAKTGDLVQAAEALTSPAHKSALRGRIPAAVAVDMESAAVARVAVAAGVPFLAVRAVLDRAWEGLPPPLLEAVDARGRPYWPRLAYALLRHPALSIPLRRLARARRHAARSLCWAATELAGLNGAPSP